MPASGQNSIHPEIVTGTCSIPCQYTSSWKFCLATIMTWPKRLFRKPTEPVKKYDITLLAFYQHLFLTRQIIP